MNRFQSRRITGLATLLLAFVASIDTTNQEVIFPGIIFIKTHKTASSAVAALFRANALLAWNQSVFIPEIGRGGHQWDFFDPRQRVLARYQDSAVTGSAPYGVWASHLIYHPHVRSLVPNPEAILVTCVREPVQRLFSAWTYYRRIGLLKDQPIENLLQEDVRIHSEFHPNGMVLELAGVGFEELMRGSSGDKKRVNDTVSAFIEAAWQPGAKDALINAGAGVVAAINSHRLIALVTERLDESLRLLLWPRGGWRIQDLYELQKVDPTPSQVPSVFRESISTTLDSSQITAMSKASFLDNEVYAAAVRILEESRQTNGDENISRISKCPVFSVSKMPDAADACTNIHDELSQYKTVRDVSSCPCALLGLNDIQWSEFAHQSTPLIESNQSLKLSRKAELKKALAAATNSAMAPVAACTLDGYPVLCSVAAESLRFGANLPQSSLGISSNALFRVISLSSGKGDDVACGCGAEDTDGSGDSAEVSVLGTKQRNIGHAALVARGGCSFQEKAKTLEAAGYIAVFICDNNGGDVNHVPPAPSLGEGSGVTIPVFMINQVDGKQVATKARNGSAYIRVILR